MIILEVEQMKFRGLGKEDLERVLDLFCVCFSEDKYYKTLFADSSDMLSAMRESFRDSINFCLSHGIGIGITDGTELIGFALLFDYQQIKTRYRDEFNAVFGAKNGEKLPYEDQFHSRIEKLQGNTLYLLSIAVKPVLQSQGLASCIIDRVLTHYKDYNLVSDVSNEKSLGLYAKRQFQIDPITEDYFFVLHKYNNSTESVDFSDRIHLLVPSCKALDMLKIDYQVKRDRRCLGGYQLSCSAGIDCFVEQEDAICEGVLVDVDYGSLLQYQRLINLSQVEEHICGDVLFYEHLTGYSEPPLFNETLSEMISCRKTEWSLIPDVFVSLPVSYQDLSRIKSLDSDSKSDLLLQDMEFRTHYEGGIPSALERVDDLAGLKKRIQRFRLEKVKIQITDEMTVADYNNTGAPIGPSTYADVYLSVDTGSNCAVLTWYVLSCPFLVSQLFDNIIRNQILIEKQGQLINFYDHIQAEYGLIKRGTPKIFSVFPCSKERLADSQLASLLLCETIYPDGESFGNIIDEDLLAIVQSEHGMGQYDRAFVCAYTNAVFQFSEQFSGSVRDRLCEESITLFYVELILFEEAAIHIADRAIINLFTETDSDSPIDFLAKVDAIYDDYTKTIDFWDTKVNYPSSQKSIDMLREAFRIKDQLEEMKRNQDQLQITFQTKCDMIDRKDAKRMDTSLAIISVLAVFSAWIDGHDYIATWNDLLSGNVIHILQKILFIIILITAVYAVTHLFRNRIGIFLRKKRERLKSKRFNRK